MIALIDDYRKELLQINTFAVDTVENYVSCIVSYCEYAKNSLEIVPVYSKGPHILKWMAHLREKGISNSRMQHHHSALKTFFALLCKLKIITKNPAEALPVIRKKRSNRNQPIPKRAGFKLLRSVDQSTWHGKRNFSVISMLWALGLRVSELTSLKVKSFEPDHDPENRIGLLRVRGKNKKQRALFVVDKLYDVLTDYLNHSESPKKKNAPLFPIQSGTAISNDRVLKMIKEYSVKADIKERITPHVLRHCFATEMYHKGVPLSAIQAMLGHCTKAETAIYVHVSDQLQKQVLEQITIEGRLSWQ
jgi:site-specific recombinase XerD